MVRRITEFMHERSQAIVSISLFLATIWLSHFYQSRSFGLYEDDYSRIPQAIGMSLSDLFNLLKYLFTEYVGQGRPLHLASIFTNAHLGSKIAGIWGIYIFGYGIFALAAILFYLLLRRIAPASFAGLATLVFCVYSADTNQAYITSSLGLYPSLVFLLIAMHLFLSNRKLLAYAAAVGVLLMYETPYPMLFAMPFLRHKWDRKLRRDLILNTFILSILLLSSLGIRYFLGEGRVTSSNFLELSITSLEHMAVGPVVNLGTFLLRPFQAVQGFDIQIGMIVFFSAFAFLVYLRTLRYEQPDLENLLHDIRGPIYRRVQNIIGERSHLKIVFGAFFDFLPVITLGFMFLVLSYAFTFTIRAYAITGRDTRVHFAGILGASMIWGSVLHFALFLLQQRDKKQLGSVLISIMLALTVGFGFVVQNDYARSWQLQRTFWNETLDLVPDITEGTVILVDPIGLEDGKHIGANTWNLPMVLEQIFEFPATWEVTQKPRVYRLTPDWKDYILGEEGLFHLNARTVIASRSYDRAVDPAHVVMLSSKNHQLNRNTDAIILNDIPVTLKTIEPPYPNYTEGVLYSLLIENQWSRHAK
jgi:hypothetical protein